MRFKRSTSLDLATAGLLVVAAAMFVHDRALPALKDRGRLDPGDRAGEAARFRSIASGDTVEVRDDGAAILMIFRSTCPVCDETAPVWSRLAALAPRRVLPIGLESDSSAAAWVARKLPGVAAVSPLDPARFVDRLRIRAVPTTLFFEDGRLAFSRLGPLQTDDYARIHRALLRARPDPPVGTRTSR